MAAMLTVGSDHLDHGFTFGAKVAWKSGSVRAGALYPESRDLTKSPRPPQKVLLRSMAASIFPQGDGIAK